MIRSLVRNLTRLCVASVLLALSLCAVEVGLRAARLKSHMQAAGRASSPSLSDLTLTEPSRICFLDVIPLLDISRQPEDDPPYRIRTNDWGLRGSAVDVPKPRGVYRVLCLGGEETFAAHVEEQATYAHQLQQLLQERSSLKVEVLNGGCPQAGPLVNLLRLRHLSALQPDLVILTVSPIDRQRDLEVHRFLHLDDAGHASYAAHPLLRGEATPFDHVCNEFYTADWVAQIASREFLTFNDGARGSVLRRRSDEPAPADAEAKLATKPFLEAAELSQGIYAKCIWAVCPSVWDMRGPAENEAREEQTESERFRELLRTLSVEYTIPLCDVTEDFRSRPDLRRLFSASAGQLSSDGHALFAARLGRFIVENVSHVWTGGASPDRGVVID